MSYCDGMAAFPDGEQLTHKELVGRSYRRPALLKGIMESSLARYLYYNLDAKTIFRRWTCSVHGAQCGAVVDRTLAASHIEAVAIDRFLAGVVKRSEASDQVVIVYIIDVLGGKPSPWENSDDFWSAFELKAARVGIATQRTSAVLIDSACGARGCYLFRDAHWSAGGHHALAVNMAHRIPPAMGVASLHPGTESQPESCSSERSDVCARSKRTTPGPSAGPTRAGF